MAERLAEVCAQARFAVAARRHARVESGNDAAGSDTIFPKKAKSLGHEAWVWLVTLIMAVTAARSFGKGM
jgi:hypothetical protein